MTDQPTEPDPATQLAVEQESAIANTAEQARLSARCVALRVQLNAALARVAELEAAAEADSETSTAVDD